MHHNRRSFFFLHTTTYSSKLWDTGTLNIKSFKVFFFKKEAMSWCGVAMPVYKIRKLRFRCHASSTHMWQRQKLNPNCHRSLFPEHMLFPSSNAVLCLSWLFLCFLSPNKDKVLEIFKLFVTQVFIKLLSLLRFF